MPFVTPPYPRHGSAIRSESTVALAIRSATLMPVSPYFDGE